MPAANRLRELIDNPGSFEGTPGFQFARDQGLQAAQRAMSRTRGSGNALAELTRLGTGYAAQDYGNMVDRLRGIVSDENQFTLGSQANDNARRRGDQDYGLGLYRAGNDFTLGSRAADNAGARTSLDWWNSTEDQAAKRRREALDWWDRYNTGGG